MTRKKLLWIFGILAALVLLTTLIGPGIILQAVRQPAVAENYAYIDSFYLPCTEQQTNLIVLTTGVHGMEGFIGAAMLDGFFSEVYPTETAWREKTVEDFKAAAMGVLSAKLK